MRILYFTRDYTPHDHRFLSAIAASTHEVFSLRLERRGVQREDRALPPGVQPVRWLGGQREARWQDGLALRRDLRRVIAEVQPDVIHAGTIQTAAFLTALAGFRPLVSMSWGSDLLKDADRSRAWRWATRYTLRHTDILLGDCQAVSDKAQSFGFPAERVVLFPWGVDLNHFSPAAASPLRERLGWQDAFVLLSLRSWEPIYGVDVLLRAFARAVRTQAQSGVQQPPLRLLLLGNGSQAPLIHHMVAENQLEACVHFGGQVNFDRLPEYYRTADLYVSASHSDGSSVSLMEALACGRPVLVSDIPGNCEWITPGQTGWLFPDGDAAALADGMLRAADQAQHLPAVGRAARALAEERADWHKNSQKLLAAYERAAQMAGGRRGG